MADCSDSRKKTKCCGTRGGPKLQTWIWCALVQCFLSIPQTSSIKCLDVDVTVAMVPEGDIAIKYGDPLELFCMTEDYSSNDIHFSVAEDIRPSDIVNSTTRRLYISRPEKSLTTYYCINNKTGKVCPSRVIVDTLPEPVESFSCISKNLESLNCSWTRPIQHTKVDYSVTFSINDNLASPPCAALSIPNVRTSYCMWSTTSRPGYRQTEEMQYFYLTSCNIFGCRNQNFSVNNFAIVKPDPPIDLRVVENNTHSVILRWKIPNNIVDFLRCGVDHIIEYQIAKLDNQTQFHSVNTSSLPPRNKTYRFHLTNLPYAHMKYGVRVYIKSKKADKNNKGYWSTFSYKPFYTLSERPRRPPDMIAGSFDQSIYGNRRVIYVYWKQLEEYEEAGENFTYKIIVRREKSNDQTLFPDKTKSLSYLVLNESLGALDITVYSFNSVGSSVNSSHLYIPSERDTRFLKLKSFTKLAYENGTYELSWVKIKNVDNYTLFWCHHNLTHICTGRMDFVTLHEKKSNHMIDLPREYRYQFAISANVGNKTSGMVWAQCDIAKEAFVLYRFPVQLTYDIPGKSFVILRWEMECSLKDGIVSGYNISYCPIIQTSSDCDKSVENKYVYVPNSKTTFVNVTNLLPYRTYQFSIALNTLDGLKTIENATAVITTSADTPTKPVNVEISNVRNDSLVISWDPPIHRNGVIGQYKIYVNNNTDPFEDIVSGTDTTRRNKTLSGLKGFTNYTFVVVACNVALNSCSNDRDGVFVRTRIGPPSRLKRPDVEYTSGKIKWNPPEFIGAESVGLYQIRRFRDDMDPEIIANTTELFYHVIHCEGAVSEVSYEVRAINFDEDQYHGVIFQSNVTPPMRSKNEIRIEYLGEWSDPPYTVGCKSTDGMAMIITFAVLFVVLCCVYGSTKAYKKYKKMEDIKPVLPSGLGIPEKDVSRYAFTGGWNPNSKDEKPSSDEMLLLPNSKTTPSSTDITQKDDHCVSSDHTDSTSVIDSTRDPGDIQVSTSDDGSDSSLNLDADPVKGDSKDQDKDSNFSTDDTESSCENSPYLNDQNLKKNPVSSYVQASILPVMTTSTIKNPPQPQNTATNNLDKDRNFSTDGNESSCENSPYLSDKSLKKNPVSSYVQAGILPVITASPIKNRPQPPNSAPQPASSSYVMAGLQPPVYPPEPPVLKNPISPSSGYLCIDPDNDSKMSFSKLSPKMVVANTLPIMPTLPTPIAKISPDSSCLQMQSLDSLPSLKPNVCNTVPLKPPASSGYVSHGDVVINKHLNNMLIADQLGEGSAILDPEMSPDAYCRFSWNTDPTNDNLHMLLAESSLRTTKN